MRLSRLAVSSFCLALACLPGCESSSTDSSTPAAGTRIEGHSAALGGGQVTTWATADGKGGVSEAGVTLPLAVLQAKTPESVAIEFPSQVMGKTFLQHIYFNLEEAGHPPGVYMVPHMDLHFMGISIADREAIDCAGEVTPAAAKVPQNYLIPGLGAPPADPNGTCQPKMGVHAIDLTSAELAPSNPAPFTKTMIVGFHGGQLIFVEPMVTYATLQAKQAFSFSVPRPASLGRKTLWPGKIDATFDTTANAYRIVLSGFTAIE